MNLFRGGKRELNWSSKPKGGCEGRLRRVRFSCSTATYLAGRPYRTVPGITKPHDNLTTFRDRFAHSWGAAQLNGREAVAS